MCVCVNDAGDGHAAQGDGEVCGSAIETDMFVRARLSVIKAGAGPSIDQLQYVTWLCCVLCSTVLCCPLSSVLCPVCCPLSCVLSSVLCAVCCVLCALSCVLCALLYCAVLSCVLCAVLCSVSCVLCAVCSVLCPVSGVLCALCCVLRYRSDDEGSEVHLTLAGTSHPARR